MNISEFLDAVAKPDKYMKVSFSKEDIIALTEDESMESSIKLWTLFSYAKMKKDPSQMVKDKYNELPPFMQEDEDLMTKMGTCFHMREFDNFNVMQEMFRDALHELEHAKNPSTLSSLEWWYELELY